LNRNLFHGESLYAPVEAASTYVCAVQVVILNK